MNNGSGIKPEAATEGGRQPLRIRKVNETKEDYAWFTLITHNSAPPAKAERGVREMSVKPENGEYLERNGTRCGIYGKISGMNCGWVRVNAGKCG